MKKVDTISSKSKIIPFLKKYWLVLALFVFSLIVNLVLFNWKYTPIFYPDSHGYISIAKEIANLHFPDLSIRTPIYPFYLSVFHLFGNMNWAMYGQIFFAAFSIPLFYLIIRKVIKLDWLAAVITAIIALDYQIINFQSIILTESLSVFLLLLSLHLHIATFDKKLRAKNFLLLVLVDLLLLFLRPSYIIFPAALYVLKIIFTYVLKRKRKYLRNLKYFYLGIGVNIVAVIAYCFLMSSFYGFFGMTKVSDVNLTGKVMQYGYLNPNLSPEDHPTIVQKAIESVKKYGTEGGPYKIVNDLEKENEKGMNNVKKVNNYFIKRNFFNYVKESIKLIPKVFNWPRAFYTYTDITAGSRTFHLTNLFFNFLNNFKVFGFLASLIIGIYLIVKKRKKELIALVLVLSAVFYTILISATFSPSEYIRLRIAAEPLLNFLVFFPIIFVVLEFVGFIRKKSNIKK